MSVQSLPNELLLSIIRDVVGEGPAKDAMNSFMQSAYVSHVCHRWRAIMLSRQEFWAVVPQNCVELTSLSLERCHSGPLEIVVDASLGHDARYRASIRLALDHLMRVKRFKAGTFSAGSNSYHDYPHFPHDMWFSPFGRKVPEKSTRENLLPELMGALSFGSLRMLEELSLSFEGDRRWRYRVPAGVLRGRRISLQGCRLPQPDYHFPYYVRSLDLDGLQAWRSMAEMVQFFEAVPHLEHFSYAQIREGGPNQHYWQATLPELRSVRLEHLHTLHITGAIMESYVTFSCLSLAPSTDISIKGSVGDHPLSKAQYVALLDRIETTLREHFSTAIEHGRSFDAVRVSDHSLSGTKVGSQSMQSLTAGDPSVLGDLSMDVPYYYGPRSPDPQHQWRLEDDPTLRKIAHEVVFSFPMFTETSTLIFKDAFMSLYNRHRAILNGFPRAEIIQLRDSADIWVFYTAVRKERVFPQMRCVRIAGAVLDEMKRSTLERLIDALRTTYADVEMRFEVRRCEVGRKMMEDLKTRMQHGRFDWDGYNIPLNFDYPFGWRR